MVVFQGVNPYWASEIKNSSVRTGAVE